MCKRIVKNSEYKVFRRTKENGRKITVVKHEIDKYIYNSTYLHVTSLSWRRFKKSLQ